MKRRIECPLFNKSRAESEWSERDFDFRKSENPTPEGQLHALKLTPRSEICNLVCCNRKKKVISTLIVCSYRVANRCRLPPPLCYLESRPTDEDGAPAENGGRPIASRRCKDRSTSRSAQRTGPLVHRRERMAIFLLLLHNWPQSITQVAVASAMRYRKRG